MLLALLRRVRQEDAKGIGYGNLIMKAKKRKHKVHKIGGGLPMGYSACMRDAIGSFSGQDLAKYTTTEWCKVTCKNCLHSPL